MNILLLLVWIVVLFCVVMLHVAYATYFERKIIGHMQVRLGPMEVGWHGLLQPIADGVKSFFKEDIIPANADRPTFLAAPIICLVAMMASLAVLPFAPGWVLADIDIGLLFVFAMSSLASYGVVLAGWASNSKYSFLGGLRSMAQVISYEISMGLSLVGVMLMAGSLNLSKIVEAQGDSFLSMYLFPRQSASSCSSSACWPRPTGCRSTCPRPRPSWSPATPPSTAACATPSSSWPSTSA